VLAVASAIAWAAASGFFFVFSDALSLGWRAPVSLDTPGVTLAIASGASASGVGYAVWYAALPGLKATSAATVQLSVPVLAAPGGFVFLGESVTPGFALAAAVILGGMGLVFPRKL
jgi:drug/metabolite transporter (DMT)-like permease